MFLLDSMSYCVCSLFGSVWMGFCGLENLTVEAYTIQLLAEPIWKWFKAKSAPQKKQS